MIYTIGQLAKKFHLSRSTLLYYDTIGLCQASDRTKSNYRKYSEDDVKRLGEICTYRQAGLSLRDIKKILDSPSDDNVSLLERQLELINEQINRLRKNQYALVRLLKDDQMLDRIRVIKKDVWVTLLQSVGFDEITSEKWHAEFERLFPDEHQKFLETMGLPADKIQSIRAQSAISSTEG